MREDMLPILDQLELAVAAQNPQQTAALLTKLKDVWLDAGEEFCQRFDKLEKSIIHVLSLGLSADQLADLVGFAYRLFAWDVWETFEGSNDHLTDPWLWRLSQRIGLPSPYSNPQVHARLAKFGGPELSDELIATIESLARREAEEGASLTNHQQLVRNFRYIQWLPEDHNLSDLIYLLTAREDPSATSACARYLCDLPWGTDRRATMALIGGMSLARAAENFPLLIEALEIHQRPIELRMALWRGVAQQDPNRAVLGVVADLQQVSGDEEASPAIEAFHGLLFELAEKQIPLDRPAIASAVEQIDPRRWSRGMRGALAYVLRTELPEADRRRVSGAFDRLVFQLAEVWETIRLDHMGCLIPLLGMLGIGLLGHWILNATMGPADLKGEKFSRILFMGWIFWSVANVRTHFSRPMSIQGSALACVIYFTLLLGSLIVAIAARWN
ncbi:hypothetical protein [Blastopirellula marina]|uniref:Uncharacterized protein n=1 Tax=Blastopirellula marina TaxID=124 RepID=A0A2S8FWR2_9BACT|nr:hypothetical protein [Blastopirellula marina]PQO36615.1 hypothetical protein C5Y98_11505 [Blastopirellula marina]PTL44445.1 hypothetical protein C5Y97_11515 [Blastopirellula marina]